MRTHLLILLFSFLAPSLLVLEPAQAEDFLNQWHLKQATEALAKDKSNPTRLEHNKGELVFRIPGHGSYAQHSAYSAFRVLDGARERIVEGSRAKEARSLLVKGRRQELKATMQIAEQLTKMTPSRKWVRVRRHYAARQDVPYDGLSLVKMYRLIRRDLRQAIRGHSTIPASEALSSNEAGRLRQLNRLLGAKLRTHDRASIFGRMRRKWKAQTLRSDRRIRDRVNQKLSPARPVRPAGPARPWQAARALAAATARASGCWAKASAARPRSMSAATAAARSSTATRRPRSRMSPRRI